MKKASICIIGGKLQGVEACYLAKKADFHVTLIDKNEECPARKLADDFHCLDVLKDDINAVLTKCEMVIPAIEDRAILQKLEKICKANNIVFAHDSRVYDISSDKIKSDELFKKLEIKAPKTYPDAPFPLIVKPSGESGSKGVVRVRNKAQLDAVLKNCTTPQVVQEFVKGHSFSVEVIGDGVNFYPLQITQIITDENYDCNRVLAGFELSDKSKNDMYNIANTLGKALNIHGVFDIETVLYKGEMYVLEIDARLPSQTPTTVFYSTGVNMVKELYKMLVQKIFELPPINEINCVVYEHILINEDEKSIKFLGENIMGTHGKLEILKDFHGADEAIVSELSEDSTRVATLIFSDEKWSEVWGKRNVTVQSISNYLRHKESENG